jgi:class 3 adenylate cyclase
VAADIEEWLEGLGLGKYAEAFIENEIEFETLPRLDTADLKELGLPIGPRKKFFAAIEAADRAFADLTDSVIAGSPPRTAEAERRQLTVMFCDLVGSTALSRRLDPEDLRDIIRRYQDGVARAVTRYGGHVAKYLGDGVLVYFGWPQAFENQAERAVRAGLDAVAAVSGITSHEDGGLNARVGIATGQVVVGDLVGDSGRDAEAVTGETPNLAARLQSEAEIGQVVISASTRDLVGATFELVDLGPRTLKGYDEPVLAWRVVGESRVEDWFEAADADASTRMVGREQELALLRDRWELAKSGEGQTVLLAGEAGIGKSRIVDAVRTLTIVDNGFHLRYQCSPFHTNSAFHPIIQHLERAAGFGSDDDDEAKLDKLEQCTSS